MTKPTTLAWMTCALLTVHAVAHAQTPADTRDRASPSRPIEVTPYVSAGSAAASGVGAAVRWPIGSKFGVELETELKRDQITAVAIALSLVYDLPSIGRVTPYVAGGVGLAQHGVVYFRPGGELLRGTATGLTLNAGGGVRVPVTDRWGVRSDARLLSGDTDSWRIFNGATFGVGGKR
jgi:opacity protein-like surface antigen